MQAAEHLGSGQREAVGDAGVVGFLHSAGGDAEAEKAGLEVAKFGVHPSVVFHIAQAESRSFASSIPLAVRPIALTLLTVGSRRHSSNMPCPTMPVAP
jgi:hypothetical protein